MFISILPFLHFNLFRTKASGEIADLCAYRGRNNKVQKPSWKGNGSKKYKSSYNKGPKSCS